MKASIARHLTGTALLLALALPAGAVQVGFAGGTATLTDASTVVTNNSVTHGAVDFYEEGGFKLDFIGDAGFIGNYYGAGNAVIHAHWDGGCCGTLTQIKVTKSDNTSFDLNYFVLTSNTFTGGGPASGGERVFIHASIDGITSSYSQLLPVEDWGFPATQIFLGSEFDGIKAFWFVSENAVSCFGMDNFFIDEPAPGIPEPGVLALLGLGLAGLVVRRRRR